MNIVITGAHGFVGRNLTETLKTIRDGKTPAPREDWQLQEITRETAPQELAALCAGADFVFHLAGVNRPERPEEFMTGNGGFTETILRALEDAGNACPVLVTSSIQAEQDNLYGSSKLAAEDAARAHGAKTGARVLIYRLPNLFGKWCRPHYNSVVATFCHQIARDLPITVSDPAAALTLAYIDDVTAEFVRALHGQETRDGDFCVVPVTYQKRLGQIVQLLNAFHDQHKTLVLPEIPPDSFESKLYATYLSCLPEEAVAFPLTMHTDQRGSFTELLKTANCGQVSVNVSKPGVTKGQHWHHTKWEQFIVVSGQALIRQRKVGGMEVVESRVSGECLQAVQILPGYTHSITNLSDRDDLITVMWASEPFDPAKPDTFAEKV